jgi:hypothetical protein
MSNYIQMMQEMNHAVDEERVECTLRTSGEMAEGKGNRVRKVTVQ